MAVGLTGPIRENSTPGGLGRRSGVSATDRNSTADGALEIGGADGAAPRELLNGNGTLETAGIVAAVVRVATKGLAVANSAVNIVASASPIPVHLSALKILHLRFLCGVSSDEEIPDIWKEVHASPSYQAGLDLLIQYLMSGMGYYRKEFFGHADILH